MQGISKIRTLIVLLPCLMAGNLCMAHPFDSWMRSDNSNDWGWALIGLILIAPYIAAPVLSLLSYRSKSKTLNTTAWASAVIAILWNSIADFFPLSGRYATATIILCFALLVTRMAKNRGAAPLSRISIVAAALCLIAAKTVCPWVASYALIVYYGTACAFLAWLTYRLIARCKPMQPKANELNITLFTSIKTGATALLLQYSYYCITTLLSSFMHHDGRSLSPSLSSLLNQGLAYEVAAWLVAGIVVFLINRTKERSVA